MATATAAEITMICVDNSFWMHCHPNCKAQFEAVKHYCETKFKCNPMNLAGLFRMSSNQYGHMLPPTRDLKQILDTLRGLHVDCGGQVDFTSALAFACTGFPGRLPNMKRRLLAFVGSPIDLHPRELEHLGTMLKRHHIALDVVNFYVLDTSRVDRSKLYGKYRYARKELGELVAIVNDDDNSHIVDVDRSAVCKILSESILKKNIVSLKQDEEPGMDGKVKTQAALLELIA